MDSKTLKRRALNNLQGNWGLSVGVALLAALLGGATVSGTMKLNIDQEILAEVLAGGTAAEVCHRLLDRALDAGASDNVTVVLFQV